MILQRLPCRVRCLSHAISRVSRPGSHTVYCVADSKVNASASACDSTTAAESPPGLTKKVATSVVACAGAALADPLMSLVDTAFVGRLGVLQLAALGPNGALFNVVFFLGFSALGVVATNQISAAHGASDQRAAGRSLILSSTVAFLLGLLITVVLIVAPCSALQLFQTNSEMMPYAKTYCMIRALGVSSALLMVVFQAAFRAVEDMRTPLLVVAASGLLNAVLDPILIYPLGMGIAGAAWATAASQIAGAAVFATIIHRQRHLFGLPQAWASAKQAAVSHAWSAASRAASPAAYASDHTPDDTHGPRPLSPDAKHSTSSSSEPTQVYDMGASVMYPGVAAPMPRFLSPVATAALPGGTAATAHAQVDMHEPRVLQTVCALLKELPWKEFITTSLKLAVRCLLVLSTWTFASVAATKVGTYTMAAYQIMQQVLQLQLSVCWAFLVVGQSLVGVAIARGAGGLAAGAPPSSAHAYGVSKVQHSETSTEKKQWSEAQREARVVGSRVVVLAIGASVAMAVLTFVLRDAVPKLFTTDASVLKLVEGSVLMMCMMLAISWNNAIEGVLMGAGDTQFVIDMYPVCVGGFVVALAGTVAAGWGLVGIWAALVLYYVGLSSTLSARYWMQRFRCKI